MRAKSTEEKSVVDVFLTAYGLSGLCDLSANVDRCFVVFPKSSTSGDVVVFNVLTLSIINVIHAHITPIAAIAVSPCGNLLATASDAVRTRGQAVLLFPPGAMARPT